LEYSDLDTLRTVKTSSIGAWLELASRLERVTIDAWRFDTHDDFECRPAAEQKDSDSAHLTRYSTALTRFIFVANALEETYRFIDAYCTRSNEKYAFLQSLKLRSPSIKSAILIDKIPREKWPENLEHLSGNFSREFKHYLSFYKIEISGMGHTAESEPSYALHLIRNLRNHVAHGAFPIAPNPEYDWMININKGNVFQILNKACRLASIYIQMLICEFNVGFCSGEYLSFDGSGGEEFEYFLENCNFHYVRNLHIEQDFSFESAFNYRLQPWKAKES
jgi:hypothetical protein